jgi:hypothetical protein
LQIRRKRFVVTVVFAVLWIGAVAVGLRSLFAYEHRAGAVGTIARSWPGSQVPRASDRPTLVMIAHPRCACTRASVGELAEVMAVARQKIAAYVLFVTPREAGDDWTNTALEHEAAAIPGVTVISDLDGAEARRFGAETSGHTFLFAADGRLLFSGGITGSRGHLGDNLGKDAVVSLASNETAAANETLVFGCALKERSKASVENELAQ